MLFCIRCQRFTPINHACYFLPMLHISFFAASKTYPFSSECQSVHGISSLHVLTLLTVYKAKSVPPSPFNISPVSLPYNVIAYNVVNLVYWNMTLEADWNSVSVSEPKLTVFVVSVALRFRPKVTVNCGCKPNVDGALSVFASQQ